MMHQTYGLRLNVMKLHISVLGSKFGTSILGKKTNFMVVLSFISFNLKRWFKCFKLRRK